MAHVKPVDCNFVTGVEGDDGQIHPCNQTEENAKADAINEAQDHSVEMMKKVKVLNAYLQLVPEAAAFVNDCKSVAANYLADNASVSSIPVNFRSLSTRHLHWVMGLVSDVKAKEPKFTDIVDGATYRAAQQKIAEFQDKCDSDKALASAESRFVSDLSSVDRSLEAMQTRGSILVKNLKDSKVQGLGDVLAAKVTKLLGSLAGYRTKVTSVSKEIMVQQQKRQLLCAIISHAWEDIADAKLRQVDAADANKIISDIDATLRGANLYAAVSAEIANARSDIDDNVDALACPLHAQRAVLAAKGLVTALRKSISEATVSADIKSGAGALVNAFEASLATREAQVKDAMSNRDALARERQRLTSLTLQRYRSKLSSECVTLAQNIIKGKSQESAGSEAQFAKYWTDCRP